MDLVNDGKEFHWINTDYFNGNCEILDLSRFLLQQSMENPEGGKPIMLVDIEDSFGFPHPLFD